MKLYEFLQKIKDTELEHTINLRDNNRKGYLPGLDFSIYVKSYQFSGQFKERANEERGEQREQREALTLPRDLAVIKQRLKKTFFG